MTSTAADVIASHEGALGLISGWVSGIVWDDITKDAFAWDYQREDENGWSSQWRIEYRRRS